MTIASTTHDARDDVSGLVLARPDRRYIPSYIEALREGMKPARNTTAEKEIDDLQHGDAAAWAWFAETIDNGKGTADSCLEDLFWLTKDAMFLGYVSLRSNLAQNRRDNGGDVGTELRPGARHKGYGTISKSLIKEIARNRGYHALELVTAQDNVVSIASIKKSGGVLVKEIPEPDPYYFDRPAVKFRIPLHEGAM